MLHAAEARPPLQVAHVASPFVPAGCPVRVLPPGRGRAVLADARAAPTGERASVAACYWLRPPHPTLRLFELPEQFTPAGSQAHMHARDWACAPAGRRAAVPPVRGTC